MTAAPDVTDPELDRVIDLSNAGHDWLTACRMVFAPDLLPARVTVSERLRARLHAEAGRTDGLVVWLACVALICVLVVAR